MSARLNSMNTQKMDERRMMKRLFESELSDVRRIDRVRGGSIVWENLGLQKCDCSK